MLACTALLFQYTGLMLDWSSLFPAVWLPIGLGAFWIYFYLEPGGPSDWALAESLVVLILLLSFALVSAPAQYGVVALKRPIADAWLARADSALGLSVPAMTEWTRAHPALAQLLIACYKTFLGQVFVPPLLFGLVLRDRDVLVEYAFHFHVCLVVCLIGLVLVPTEFSFTFFGFTPLLNVDHVTRQFAGLQAGTFSVVRFDDLDGMVSFPSFHVAVGLIVTWAARRRWWAAVPLAVVNTGLTAATFLTGVHYVVDSIASLLLVGASILAWRRLAGRLTALSGHRISSHPMTN